MVLSLGIGIHSVVTPRGGDKHKHYGLMYPKEPGLSLAKSKLLGITPELARCFAQASLLAPGIICQQTC